MTRIQERARDGENKIQLEYLKLVETRQEDFLSELKDPILVLDGLKPRNLLLKETLRFLKEKNFS